MPNQLQEKYNETYLESNFVEIAILPRWAYTDSEWCDLVLVSDLRFEGRLFIEMAPELNMLKYYLENDGEENV